MRWSAIGLCALAIGCGSDDKPAAPPTILAAYVIDPSSPDGCDLTDPRSWGGNFEVLDARGNPLYLRCVPDLLNPLDQIRTKSYPYDVQLRVVFSERVSVGDIASAVSATTANGRAVPFTARYDPNGTDFKQGIEGTAPPGPAIVVAAGNGSNLVGLPSGANAKICFAVANLAEPRCIDLVTSDFCLAPAPGLGSPPTIADLKAGITIPFTAPAANSDLADPRHYAARLPTAIDPSCYSITPTTPLTPQTSMGVTVAFSDTPPCSLPQPPFQLLFTIDTTLPDQYGSPFCGAGLFWIVGP